MVRQIRAACAPTAAVLSVAAVLTADSLRGCGSWLGSVGSPVHAASCTLWCTMPLGACMRSRNSTSQRASSSTSGTPLWFSGIDSVPSPSAEASPSATARS